MSGEPGVWICPCCHGGHLAADPEELEMFERLEAEFECRRELLEDGNYQGLVTFLEGVVARRPDDPYARRNLGEAYLLNGETQKAIELLSSGA